MCRLLCGVAVCGLEYVDCCALRVVCCLSVMCDVLLYVVVCCALCVVCCVLCIVFVRCSLFVVRSSSFGAV